MKTIGYIRVSTDKQDEENQRIEISRLMEVDEWIASGCSSRKTQDERGITELLDSVSYGDTVVVTELSRLARSTSELLLMVDKFIKAGVGLTALKQGIKIPANGGKMDAATKTVVTMFGLMAELERDFISMRTKMGLAAKKSQGVVLGRKKGELQPSGLDVYREIIHSSLQSGVTVARVARDVGFSRTAVKSYILSRGL